MNKWVEELRQKIRNKQINRLIKQIERLANKERTTIDRLRICRKLIELEGKIKNE